MRHILFFLALFLFTGSQFLQAQQQSSSNLAHPTVIGHGTFLGISAPLRDLVPTKQNYVEIQSEKEEAEFEFNSGLAERNYPYYTPSGPDPVWQKFMPQAKATTNLILNIAGQSSPYYPSDCNGQVGQNYYMQGVNSSYAIYDKSGNLVVSSTAFNTLFTGVTGSSNNDGDIIVLYDDNAQRWFASEFDISDANNMQMIAVSVTDDPTGSWYKWSFDVDDMPDYGKFGIWEDGYYFSDNNSGGTDVYVFERSVMLAGGASPQMVGFSNANRPASGFHCIEPLDNDGQWAPAGTPGQFITINDDAWGGLDELWIYELSVDWSNTANSTFGRTQTIAVPQFDSNFGTSWDNISQPGTTSELDAIPQILMYRAQYRNWGTSQTIVCAHTVDVDGTDHAGVRWYELENTGSGWSIRQNGTYAPDNQNRWLPSIAMNGNHEIAIGYNVSGSTVYPSIRYTGQSAGENAAASGILDIPETTIQDGTAAQTATNRWGDYADMSIDPSDDLTFWFTTEYYNSGKKTKIAEFRFVGADDPAGLTANAVNYDEIDLSWNLNTNSDPVLLAWSSDGTFGTPVDGTTYNPGDAIPGGGTVLSYGTNLTYNHTGLTEQTTYYYKAWSYLPANTYSTGVTAQATTPAAPITSYPFTWDFESSADYTQIFTPWTTYDGNGTVTYSSSDADFTGEGTAFAWLAMNPVASGWTASAQGDDAHGGSRCGMSICPSDGSTTDHWFISPQLQLGTASSFSLWTLTPKTDYGLESYEIMVSTTDNQPSSFTSISGSVTAPANWTQQTYDLSAYDGQTIYIAIHDISTDIFMMWIDDLEILSTTSSCTTPSFASQPSNIDECAGNNASFSVSVTATPPITYQWQQDGSNITGATNSTYSITGVASGDAGTYTCIVTDSCGTQITSNGGILTVSTTPAISTQPSSATDCEGSNVTFDVAATGSNLTYQWQLDGNNISGATNSTYTISGIAAGDAGNYTCVVTNVCGTVTSNPASLTVNQAPAITTQPSGITECAGNNVSFSVTATGTGTLTYQWQHDGTNISGATGSTYDITGVAVGDAGSYTCVVTNACGTITSNTATLTVNQGPAISTQPSDIAACETNDVTFIINASGVAPLTYQWVHDGVNISGATNSTLTVTGISSGDAGNYLCVVTDACGTVSSNTATLSINQNTAITTQPVNLTANEGDNVNFTVVATGNNLAYQWKKDGSNLSNGGNISGVTTSTLSLTSVTTADYGNYNCDVTGDCGVAESDSALLTIIVSNNDLKAYGLNIFPNPSEGTFTIDFGKTMSQVKISVRDIAGREVYNKDYNASQKAVIDLTNQAKGSYIIEIDLEGKTVFAKLIIEK